MADPSSRTNNEGIENTNQNRPAARVRGIFEQTFAEKIAERRRNERAARLKASQNSANVSDQTLDHLESELSGVGDIVDPAASSIQSAAATTEETETFSLATPSGKEFTKEEATSVVRAILISEENRTPGAPSANVPAYQLIDFPEYQARLRGASCRLPRETRALDGFFALCPSNSLQKTGIVVCKFVHGGGCSLEKGIFRYNSASGGTSTFKNHTDTHTKRSSQRTLDTNIPLATKNTIVVGAAKAVVQDLVPFDFVAGPGMQAFALACFRAGQMSSALHNIDISKALPSPATVTKAVGELANGARNVFQNQNYRSARYFGGALTTDGLKHKPTGKKFYDLSMMYFATIGEGSIQGPTLKLVSRVLLLEEHTAHNETAEAISDTLNDALRKRYGVELKNILPNFTLVTDRASTLPVVAGASASAAKCAYQEKWLFCMPHYLNTIMKRCIDACKSSEVEELKRIGQDLTRAKEVVRVFKAGDWQKELGDGHKLIQEVTTRFSTTFHVVERFLESIVDIERILYSPEYKHDGARSNLEGISTTKCPETAAITDDPALAAIVKAFECIVTVQQRLEADSTPTIQFVLPYMELIRSQLEKLFAPSSTESDHTKALAKVVHAQVTTMTEHPLHAAACLLVPTLRNLEFITNDVKRDRIRASGLAQIRRLMGKAAFRKNKLNEEVAASANTASNSDSRPSIADLTPAKRKRNARSAVLSLKLLSDNTEVPKQGEDELALYLATSAPVDLFKEQFDIDDPMAPPTFWLRQRSAYPELFEVCMRIFATPTSSCTSERVFSVVARTLTVDRSRMTPENLSNIVIARSALSRGVRLEPSTAELPGRVGPTPEVSLGGP